MIGVDIESITRFNKLDRRKNGNFLNRIFSPRELEYCYSRKDPAPHLTARFAGKEAVNKALLSSGYDPLPHQAIEILNGPNGAPRVRLRKRLSKNKDQTMEISLSHSGKNAVALVIMFAKNTKNK